MAQTRSQLGPAAQKTAELLLRDLEGPAAVVIATTDGFSLGHAGTRAVDPARMAAVASSIGALADAASRETAIGATRCIVIESRDGRMVLRCFEVRGESVVVVILTDVKVLMGMTLTRLRDAEKLMHAA